jgi:hypothetical protein
MPATPTVNTVQQSASTYMAAVQNAPVVAAFRNIAAAVPAGTCPAPTFTLFSHMYTFDATCTLMASISGILEAVMLIAFTLMGARILMSA